MAHTMRTRGQIDNRNDVVFKSLSKERREREMIRITKENITMIRRIQSKKPAISREQHDREWQQNLKFMDNISSYPEDWYLREKPTTSRSNPELNKSNRSSHSSNSNLDNSNRASSDDNDSKDKKVEKKSSSPSSNEKSKENVVENSNNNSKVSLKSSKTKLSKQASKESTTSNSSKKEDKKDNYDEEFEKE